MALLVLPSAPLFAEQFGLFTCEVEGETVWITDYPEDVVGDVEIPPVSDGKAITTIGSRTFSYCSRLTSVTINSSVTKFSGSAFYACSRLTSVTILDGVTEIGAEAFSECRGLAKATFLGHALISFDAPRSVFARTAPDFTIYYLSSSSSFTSPTWEGYSTVIINELPSTPWLLKHDLPLSTDFNTDASLLIAYALDLDPDSNSINSQLEPVLDPATGTLSLSFHAASHGITYTVETSSDLQAWKTEDVTLSELAPDDMMKASVSRDAPKQFMRLVVESQ